MTAPCALFDYECVYIYITNYLHMTRKLVMIGSWVSKQSTHYIWKLLLIFSQNSDSDPSDLIQTV